MADERTVNDVKVYKDSAGFYREYPVEHGLPVAAMTGQELDTDGSAVPVFKAHSYTYDGSGNLATDTVSDGTSTWVRTYTWDNGAQASDSGWVKQ